ncbi:MAG: hypothetical protein ACLPPF_23990 [Rhodomicrobium sp.]
MGMHTVPLPFAQDTPIDTLPEALFTETAAALPNLAPDILSYAIQQSPTVQQPFHHAPLLGFSAA